MAEMRSEPLEPEPDSTGVGMVKLITLPSCNFIFLGITRLLTIMLQINTE
jgi:hypothetical protein